MSSKINYVLCRCCASEGTFKDLSTKYHWMGEVEIYADMLKDCFDVHLMLQLSSSVDSEEGGICEVCITQLRNAANFKKQVLHTEKLFIKRLQEKLYDTDAVKVEVSPLNDDLESDHVTEEFPEYEVPIKEEQQEAKPRKRAAKLAASRPKRSKADPGDTKRDADVTTRVRVSDPVVNTGGNLLHLPEMTIRKLGSNKKGEYNEKNAVNIKADRVELEKHIHNIEQILQNSNATPIKFHSSLGYSCNFCPKHYTKPAELKLHTLAKHENVENLRFAKGTLASLVVKLDITDLKCFLCRKHIESLQEFVDHLQCDHSKKIYTDINNHILPFKFSDDPNHFECVLCRDVFKSFKLTQEHMHIHYTNYTCDICNSTYVNKLCLKYHVERHMQVSSKKGKGSENIAINRDNYIMADQVEFKKHLHNIKQILNNSNATPVKAYTSLGYFCNFCPENFKKPADLKLHTLDNHKNIGKLKFTKGGMSYHLVKLDITDLKCFLCQNDIESLQQLVDHLQNDHDKHYYTDINNHILPFKFGADPNDFRCVLCPNVYKHFKQVQEHMGVHYPNYTCDVCSCMFVSKSSLQRHAERHEQGQHECSFCPKVFSSHGNKYDHERRVHKSGNLRNKCPHCPARFICYNQRNRHMVKEHGAQPVTFDCLACDKVFPSRKHLTKHTKRDHLMERRHQCQECQARFFAAKDLKKHIYTHTGVKDHKCEVCLKEFALKVNLRTHMRIHSNDRRFKCRSCGQTFIHKCSYRNHMRTQHDEVV
ncbi:zinc finger protein Xfin-like isoform X3 [Plodia interpunctella]|uniref:zinc finger protein Xfin-like isoform X3 n=1 Tax=Plodia interpunctella TaxID=58824 RepID=UPI003100B88B